MPVAHGNIQTKLDAQETKLAMCRQILRNDGWLWADTTHDADITVDFGNGNGSVLHKSNPGYQPSDLSYGVNGNSPTMEFSAPLGTGGTAIERADIEAGLFDGARIWHYIVDWTAPGDGWVELELGFVGEIDISGIEHRMEVLGAIDRLRQPFGKTISANCPYRLGEGRCQINVASFTVTTTISSISGRNVTIGTALPATAGRQFAMGTLKDTVTGEEIDIASTQNNGSIVELLWPPKTMAPGNGVEVKPGCNGTLATCRDVFNQVHRFGGFPFVTGRKRTFDPGRATEERY